MLHEPYCPNCGYEEYAIEEELVHVYRNDPNSPMYISRTAYCPKCDTIIFIDDILEEDLNTKWALMREYRDLVSLEELRKIPKKYGVPRERVEEILDFDLKLRRPDYVGYSAWIGKPLTKDASDRVRKALESPSYFMKRMEAIKDELPTEFYERAHKRLEKMVEKEKTKK